MKKILYPLTFALAAFATACAEPETPTPPAVVTISGVSFTLGFESDQAAGTATLFENESTIDGITVALFNEDGTFNSALAPTMTGANYSFEPVAGTYKMYVLTNCLDVDALKTALGSGGEDDFLALTVDTRLGKGREIPMVSAAAKEVVYAGEPTALGEIALRRMAARIDIVSAISGVTVNKVVMKNYASVGAIGAANTPAGTEHFGEKTFDKLALVGNATTPAVYTIYTYDNANLTGGNAPSFEVFYTHGDEQSSEFIFNVALTRDKLYSVQFVAEGAEIDYKAETWVPGGVLAEEFDAAEIQDGMNRGLLISRFTPYNVKTINSSTKKVTFNTSGLISASENASIAWEAGFAKNIYTDDDGNKYRVPTKDEMRLLLPEYPIRLEATKTYQMLDQDEVLPELFGVAGSGGQGKSDFRSVGEGVDFDMTDWTVNYAIRFKNTRQAAAYRYKVENLDASDAYYSIRVKALGMSLPTIDEVSNESYWEEGYIEFKVPMSGLNKGKDIYLWTATANPQDATRAYFLQASKSFAFVDNYREKYTKTCIRLVRAE